MKFMNKFWCFLKAFCTTVWNNDNIFKHFMMNSNTQIAQNHQGLCSLYRIRCLLHILYKALRTQRLLWPLFNTDECTLYHTITSEHGYLWNFAQFAYFLIVVAFERKTFWSAAVFFHRSWEFGCTVQTRKQSIGRQKKIKYLVPFGSGKTT